MDENESNFIWLCNKRKEAEGGVHTYSERIM